MPMSKGWKSIKPEREVPSQPATKTLCITVHTSKEHERDGREILFLIVGIFISVEKLRHLKCNSQMKHQLDATLCRFYFCRVTLHVSGASAHHQEYLKHVEWLCRNKTCTVLHQVGVSFDLYYDARKHNIKIKCNSSLVPYVDNHNAKKCTSKPPTGLIGVLIRNSWKFMFILSQ